MKYLPWLLVSFEGRISRQTYWLFLVVALVIIFVPAIAFGGIGTEGANTYVSLVSLVLFWPALAIQAKRWHDLNRSALWILINFLPFIGELLSLIVNGFIPGTDGPNDFGEEPIWIFSDDENVT